jgi:hypothetical protein
MRTTFDEIEVQWTGVASLLMHNGALANPLDPRAKRIKALTGKRNKTDEDHADLARAEFDGSFYWDDRFGPVVPTDCIFATIVNGAKKSKMGREVALALFVEGTPKTGDAGVVKLEYKGPRDRNELWNGGSSPFVSSRLVTVKKARLVRTRPEFKTWSLNFNAKFDASVVNREVVVKSMIDGGFYIGLLDDRPRHGRFSVEVVS